MPSNSEGLRFNLKKKKGIAIVLFHLFPKVHKGISAVVLLLLPIKDVLYYSKQKRN